MKKRFFAGLLACLMVVGLLPLSMLLKPVSAKADDVSRGVHVFYPSNMDDIAKNGANKNKIIWSDDFFKLYGHGSLRVEASEKSFKDNLKCTKKLTTGGSTSVKISGNDYTAAACVSFDVEGSAQIKIWWAATDTKRKLAVYNGTVSGSSNEDNMIFSDTADGKDVAMISTTTISSESKKTYFIGGTNGLYIYKIEVTQDSKYDVTVVDSATTETTGKVNSKSEGETFTLKAADTTNFLYWVNSYGRIVSRDAEYSFPVYYSDTYTAVYKSTETTYKFMTDYDQVYKTYTVSDLAIPTSPVKYGYEFNYWKIGETKVSTIEEIKAAGADTDVVIKPVYKEITENVSITINGVSKEYKKNEVVTADATALENFMYWHVTGDESKILSYNDLYSFYADDKISSITAKCGTDTVEKSGIITHVTNYSDGNSKTFVFEFTVPDGYTIEFAGIVASSTSTEPTLTDYEYIRGRSSSAQTYRYSWTKLNAGNTTWNVRPILKYSDGQGNIMTIDTSTVQSL